MGPGCSSSFLGRKLHLTNGYRLAKLIGCMRRETHNLQAQMLWCWTLNRRRYNKRQWSQFPPITPVVAPEVKIVHPNFNSQYLTCLKSIWSIKLSASHFIKILDSPCYWLISQERFLSNQNDPLVHGNLNCCQKILLSLILQQSFSRATTNLSLSLTLPRDLSFHWLDSSRYRS